MEDRPVERSQDAFCPPVGESPGRPQADLDPGLVRRVGIAARCGEQSRKRVGRRAVQQILELVMGFEREDVGGLANGHRPRRGWILTSQRGRSQFTLRVLSEQLLLDYRQHVRLTVDGQANVRGEVADEQGQWLATS